jgi:hypothetical protein
VIWPPVWSRLSVVTVACRGYGVEWGQGGRDPGWMT